MKKSLALLLFLVIPFLFVSCTASYGQKDNPGPPDKPVKLIFIHHSCGENWLSDENGGLGIALAKNNYFVSDTNYGWGPDSIGDRTDIVNWLEWFTGPRRNEYMSALFRESGIHSPYTRSIADPGGENQIIMFKSCFPNSSIEGSPDDPPGGGEGLTVSHAKAIYNKLLGYFATRPDKLFVVITAPPVQDSSCAANARAFNTWLVKKWLSGYKGANVAVFDFYNVLTGPGNHHRFQNGKIEYSTAQGGNTLSYPSEDDHPSAKGNKTAVKEFIPLLNVYYHRWKQGAPHNASKPPQKTPSPAAKPPVTEPAPEKTGAPPPEDHSGLICDGDRVMGNWEVFTESGDTRCLTFQKDSSRAHSGKGSLRIDYAVDEGKWATCALIWPSSQNWKKWRGIRFFVHSEKPGQEVMVTVYQGSSPDSLGHFEYLLATTAEASKAWQKVELPWSRFRQPAWDGDGKTPFNPSKAMGIAFIISSDSKSRSGRIWVDDLGFW